MSEAIPVASSAPLALEMGVGKTLVALVARRVLISCPLRVVPVWVQQIEWHLDLRLIVIAMKAGEAGRA